MDSKSGRGFNYFPFLWVILFLAGALWVILAARRGQKPAFTQKPARRMQAIQLPDTLPTGTLSAPQDLTKIEGIGPKVAKTLQQAGIITYKQLAKSKIADLKAILVAAGNRISDPTTWPEQAALAEKGAWEKLGALQSSLKGGRKVT